MPLSNAFYAELPIADQPASLLLRDSGHLIDSAFYSIDIHTFSCVNQSLIDSNLTAGIISV